MRANVLIPFVLAAVAACSMIVDADKQDLPPRPASCTEGDSIECACPSGQRGVQVCNEDGNFVGSPCCVTCGGGKCDCLNDSVRDCS